MNIKDMNREALIKFLAEARAELQELATRGTDLVGEDAERFDTLEAQHREAKERLTTIDARMEALKQFGADPSNTDDPIVRTVAANKPDPLKGALTLTRNQSLVDYNRANGIVKTEERAPSFDKYIRGLVTGEWRGADLERAFSEGSSTAGGVLVPTPVAASVIDLARNQSRVIEAGAQTVPMESSTLKLPRLTGDPGPAWRAENGPVVTNDLTFDAVTLTARSLSRQIILSRELFYDTDVSDIIAQAFAASFATELDRVALRGSGTAPEPRGILNTPGITVSPHGTNGGALSYDFLLDSAGVVLANNYVPTAHILASRGVTALAKSKESTTGAYLAPPASLLPLLATNQIPTNLSTGSSTTSSEVYTGQWNALVFGIRQGFEIEFLRERYADNGQVAFIAHLRADVAVLQPKAFVVDTGVN